MPFNANTYRANKHRKSAWQQMAEARAIKARVAAGTAYDWEARRIAMCVKLARLDMHLYLGYRRIGRLPL